MLVMLRCAAAASALSALAIFGFLLWFSLPIFRANALAALLAWDWRPMEGAFGILPMLIGSLCLALPATLLAFPLALGLCLFTHGLGSQHAARLLLATVRFMTGVPTVVYGLASAFLLVPLIRSGFAGSGFSWLAALLTLTVLVVPTIVLVLDSQFRLLREQVGLGAAALGFTPAQQLLRLVLPLSVRGLLMAAVLGFGRAIGDTLIPLMVAGNAPQVPHSLLDSLRTLTAHIALVVATDSHSAAYGSLFACGLILFLVSLLVNLGLRSLRRNPDPAGAGHA